MIEDAPTVEESFAGVNVRHKLAVEVATEAMGKLAQEHNALPIYTPLMLAIVEYARAQVADMDSGHLLQENPAGFWRLVRVGLHEDLDHLLDTLSPQEPGAALM